MKKQINYNGISFLGLLAILFIGLKLTRYIDWSWLWILSPLWIPILLWALFMLFAFVLVLIVRLLK